MVSGMKAVYCRICGLWLLTGSFLLPCSAASKVEYIATFWRTEDGLPDGFVSALEQTPDGYMWIGTRNGLARFDGNNFQTFDTWNTPQLSNSAIGRLFKDSEGTLYIGLLDGGLVSWRQGAFLQELPAKSSMQAKDLVARCGDETFWGMKDGRLLRLSHGTNGTPEIKHFQPPRSSLEGWFAADDQGHILYGSAAKKVFQLHGNELKAVSDAGLDGTNLFGLTTGSDGKIWAVTEEEFSVWDGFRFRFRATTHGLATTLSEPLGLPPLFPSPNGPRPEFLANSVLPTRDGGFWVRSGSRLQKHRDGKLVANIYPTAIPLRNILNLSCVCPDREGGFWSYGRDLGLFHIRSNGMVEEVVTKPQIPSSQRIDVLFEDREGNLWAGFELSGLAMLRKASFAVIGVNEGLSSGVIASIAEDAAGTPWVGTVGGGLNHWSNGEVAVYGRGDNYKAVVFDQNGNLWCLNNVGLGQIVGRDSWKTPFEAATVWDGRALMEGSRGCLWFGANMRLGCWDGRTNHWFGPEQGFLRARVLALAESPDGTIWIGTDTGELRSFKNGTVFPSQPPTPGSRPAVYALLADSDGALWAGTRGAGLLFVQNGKLTAITTREGLPSDVICSILDDGIGSLWFGSHAGIFSIKRSVLQSFVRGETSTVTPAVYGKHDGLPTLECSGGSQPAACRGRDGRLWFATIMGVVSVQPKVIPVNALRPQVYIQEILIDGNRVSWPGPPAMVPQLNLGPGQFNLEIKYTGLCFTAPDGVRFKHRLLGMNDGWHLAANRREVFFNYLPPGEYCFEVTACNNYGAWSDAGARFSFVVQPYWWQRKSYQVAAVAGLVTMASASAFSVARLRARRRIARLERERELEKERARVARDLHDDLGAGLTEIGLIGGLAGEVEVPFDQAKEYLRQVTVKSRELVTSLDEIVWSVNPKHDSVSALGTYLCDYAQHLLELQPIRCRMDVPAPLCSYPLNSEQRHNLLMAYKEALTNVIRHSQANEVRIRIAFEDGLLQIAITDDGRGGASPSETGTADGLANMMLRLKDIGGCCTIRSELGRGTVVTFTLPVSEDLKA